jgi:hypothetical protein
MPSNPAYDALFAQSRDLVADGLSAGLAAMLDKADESTRAVADKTDDQELRKLVLEARDVARTQRAVIEKQFREKYLTEFRKATNKAKKIAASFSDISLGELSLVDDDDLNETLKFNGAAAKVRKACEQELSAIDQRVRVLLDDPALESEDNPFAAQLICDAFKHACRQTGATAQVRLVLLKLFEEKMPEAAAESYQQVNDLLVANQILPKITYGITKSKSDPGKRAAAADKASGADKDKPAAAPEEPEDEGDVFAKIAKMLAPIAGAGGPPAPGMGVGGVPIMQGADLMGSLTKIQSGDLSGVTGEGGMDLSAVFAAASNMTNVLKELKGSNVGASMGQVDAMTLDIVSMLFDELFDDDKVPIALKGIIGRLQLPMLKVALADKDLFTKNTHPARKLLDTLGQIGYRLPADFDDTSPLFAKLEGFIEEIVEGFQDNLEIFDTVRERLEEIIVEYDHRIVEETEAAAKSLKQAEDLAIAKAAAQEEIVARVEKAPHAPRVIVEFFVQHWIKYMLIVHARDGKDSEGWKTALDTIDQLLWSTEPKSTQEERRKLASSIPGILKRVREGVTSGGIASEDSTAFFSALMRCHTEVMQAPPKAKEPTVLKMKVAATAGADPDRTSGTGMGVKKSAPPPPPAPVHADLLDFTAPVVVENPFGGGKVEVASSELDFTAAAPAALEVSAPAPTAGGATPARKRQRETIPLPARLVVGTWVQIIGEDEQRHPAKLHFVSPMKSHFLFTDRKGNKVYECSRSMLARRFENLEIEILEGEPDGSLFDRIMTNLFGKLGKPAPEQQRA